MSNVLSLRRTASVVFGILCITFFYVTSALADTTSTLPVVTIPAAAEISGYIFNNVSGPDASIHVTDNANNESEYRLYWHLAGTAWPSTYQPTGVIGTSGTWGFPANSGNVQIAAPAQSGTYEYQLKACNSAGCSDSNIIQIAVTAKPVAPSNLQFDPAPLADRIYLKWNDNSSDEAGFYVDRKFVTDGSYAGHWATIPADMTMYTDMNVAVGQHYDYRIQAYNSTGSSDYASRSDVVTAPAQAQATCTSLSFTLTDNKTLYTIGDMVNYTYSCVPTGTSAASVSIQVVKPDGTNVTYNTGTNIGSVPQRMGFSTSNLVAGSYNLRACLNDTSCTSGVTSIPFTIVAPSATAAPVPGAGAPEPSTNTETGVWAQVDAVSGQLSGSAICTRAVCGINGEWHGYVPPSSYATGSVWWPTSKRYIWQLPSQAGYGQGSFNFSTYVFTVQGGTIYNGQFTSTVVTTSPSATSTPYTTPTSTWTPATPPVPTPAPTPNMSYGTWPNTQADCQSMAGKWCTSTGPTYGGSTGYCQMATMGCPTMPRSGYMSCWDKSEVLNGGSCPMVPQNQSDCARMGKNWCNSGTYSGANSGWCSPDACQLMPPSGQMTCPDGKTFVTSFDSCPRGGATTSTPAVEYQTCTNGTIVRKGSPCSTTTDPIIICVNGNKASTMAQCSSLEIKKDEITLCLDGGGAWCTDVAGKTKGWCGQRGVQCGSVVEQPLPDPRFIDKQQLQDMNATRKNKLRDLSDMLKRVQRAKNKDFPQKIASLQKELNAIQFTDVHATEDLLNVSAEIDTLRDEADQVVSSSKDSVSQLDEKMQKRALADMKRGAKAFLKNLQDKNVRINKLIKQKIVIDPALVDVLKQGTDLAQQIIAAQTYDDARSAMELLPDVAQTLNDLLPQIEILARLPKALSAIDREVSATDKSVKQALVVAKRHGIDDVEGVQKMSESLQEARSSLALVRAGSVATDDVLDFLQTDVADKLQDARDIADGLLAIANAKQYMAKADLRLKQYALRIKKMKADDQDVDVAQESFNELSAEVKKIKLLFAGKITRDTIEEIITSVDGLSELIANVENDVGMTSQSALREQIRQSLEGGSATFDTIKINDLERLIVRAHRMSQFALSLMTKTVALN